MRKIMQHRFLALLAMLMISLVPRPDIDRWVKKRRYRNAPIPSCESE